LTTHPKDSKKKNMYIKKRIITYAVVLFVILLYLFIFNHPKAAAEAQTAELVQHFYIRYEGTINNKYNIILHLTRRAGTLSGYYYYTSQNIPLFLSGSCDAAGNVLMEESTRKGEKTGRFTGRFTGAHHITGTWQTADKKKQFPFELKESSAADYVRCTTYELIDSSFLFEESTDPPKIEISLFYVYPHKYHNHHILHKLQELILPEASGNPQKALKMRYDSYVTIYRTDNSDVYDPELEWIFSWSHDYGTAVVLNDNNMFTCRFYFYDYMGGAHPLYGEGFMTFDMVTGKKLELDDIFSKSYEQQLAPLLDRKLRAQRDIPPEAALQDYGFFVDRILPNDNFYVALDGIGFFFNIYEITPYAGGPDDIFLPFKEIKHLIKADSPVRRLFE
jgi:hypothetical protein